jgi:hypothetical protein
MRRPLLAIVVVLSAISTAPSYAQNSILGDNYSIMVPEKGYKPSKPEPWLAPKYQVPERHREAREAAEIDGCADAERAGSSGPLCPANREGGAELAYGVRIWAGWR